MLCPFYDLPWVSIVEKRTDGRTDRPSYRDAWTHLKTVRSEGRDEEEIAERHLPILIADYLLFSSHGTVSFLSIQLFSLDFRVKTRPSP